MLNYASLIDCSKISLGEPSKGVKSFSMKIKYGEEDKLIFQLNASDAEKGANIPPFGIRANKAGHLEFTATIDDPEEDAALTKIMQAISNCPTLTKVIESHPDVTIHLSKTGGMTTVSTKLNSFGVPFHPLFKGQINANAGRKTFACDIRDTNNAIVDTKDLHKYRWISMIVEAPSVYVSTTSGTYGVNKVVRALVVTPWVPSVDAATAPAPSFLPAKKRKLEA